MAMRRMTARPAAPPTTPPAIVPGGAVVLLLPPLPPFNAAPVVLLLVVDDVAVPCTLAPPIVAIEVMVLCSAPEPAADVVS